jgi:hypothetical protein
LVSTRSFILSVVVVAAAAAAAAVPVISINRARRIYI